MITATVCAAAVEILATVSPYSDSVSVKSDDLHAVVVHASEMEAVGTAAGKYSPGTSAGDVPSREDVRAAAVARMRALRGAALAKGMSTMTLDEINEDIRRSRDPDA